MVVCARRGCMAVWMCTDVCEAWSLHIEGSAHTIHGMQRVSRRHGVASSRRVRVPAPTPPPPQHGRCTLARSAIAARALLTPTPCPTGPLDRPHVGIEVRAPCSRGRPARGGRRPPSEEHGEWMGPRCMGCCMLLYIARVCTWEPHTHGLYARPRCRTRGTHTRVPEGPHTRTHV